MITIVAVRPVPRPKLLRDRGFVGSVFVAIICGIGIVGVTVVRSSALSSTRRGLTRTKKDENLGGGDGPLNRIHHTHQVSYWRKGNVIVKGKRRIDASGQHTHRQ